MRSRLGLALAILLLAIAPADALVLGHGGGISSGAITNVTAVAITNENVPPNSPAGTEIGDFSATVTGGGACTTCTWTMATSGVPTGQAGPACGSTSNNFQIVNVAGGTAHFEVLNPSLGPQIYGAPPASQTFPCVTATPAVGSSYTFAVSVMIRAPSFTSVTPLTVQYTSGVGETIPLVATMCWTDCGQSGSAPTPTYTLGSDAACTSPGLSISGQNLVVSSTYAGGPGVCHITAAAAGVICPPLGYISAPPTTCSVPVYISEGPYVGPGDATYPNGATGLTWARWNEGYAFSAAFAAAAGPIWRIVRESDRQVFTIYALPSGDMDIATLANDCDISMCYLATAYDEAGNSPDNDLIAWADQPGQGCPTSPWTGSVLPVGCPLTIWRPPVYFNIVDDVMPSTGRSNNSDRFMRNLSTYNGAGAYGTMDSVAEALTTGTINQQLIVLNAVNSGSTDTAVMQYGGAANDADLFVGTPFGVGTFITATNATGGTFHSFLGVFHNTDAGQSLIDVDGITVTGTFTSSPAPSLVKPYGENGGFDGGSLAGWSEGSGVASGSSSSFAATTMQLQALQCFHYRHFGVGPAC